MSKSKILYLAVAFIVLGTISSFSGGFPVAESDNNQNLSLFAFFDLRDRESYLQVTNSQASPSTLHVQIFNVGNLCNENDFFDDYTGNDTHVYNMRDILTNDTNPSGVDLPDDAYGIVAISSVGPGEGGTVIVNGALIGNFRILDSSGYEYRTNMSASANGGEGLVSFISQLDFYANFNQQGGVSLSDIVGTVLSRGLGGSNTEEWMTSDVLSQFMVMDVDIIDNSEVLLSCRDVIFACVQPDDPLVDEILASNEGNNPNLQGENGASVASFEYGINNTIPHSKGGELLCPGNVIGEGILNLTFQGVAATNPFGGVFFPAFIGLNNGNGRGSMDALWEINPILDF